MPRTTCDNTAFERTAYQGHIAHDIEQFMARRFVFKFQRPVVEITEFTGILMGGSHQVGNMVELFLREFLIVYNDGVVEVASLNQVCMKQRFNFADKHECAAGSDVATERCHIFQTGILVGENRRFIRHHNVDREV